MTGSRALLKSLILIASSVGLMSQGGCVAQIQTQTPPLDGAFGVGVVETDWEHAFPDSPKRLKVKVWYPAETAQPGEVAPYFSDAEAPGTIRAIETTLGFDDGSFDTLKLVKTRSISGAAIAKTDMGQFPLVMFGHGFWFYISQNTALMEQLASHGYIVVSVAHPKDSMPVHFSDGSVQETVQHSGETSAAETAFFAATTHAERIALFPAFQAEIADHRVTKSHHIWVRDALAVFDDLQNGRPDGPLADIIPAMDFGTVAFGGMSFGGATAVSACAQRSKCKAAFNLDGLQFDATFFNQNFDRPLLLVNADRPQVQADEPFHCFGTTDALLNDYFYETHASAGLNPNIVRMRVNDIKHMGFTDLPLLSSAEEHAEVLGSTKPEIAVEALNTTIRRFLDLHMKGDSNRARMGAVVPEIELRDASAIRTWISHCR
ncbi:MAG: hypothetical protein AAGF53_17320 [Pseudomonadota bacterium]